MSARPDISTFLSLAQLVDLTATVAAEVLAGEREVHADADKWWHVRLHCDHQVDVCLISSTTDQGTQLHDHGGSSGAFTVVSGELAEAVWSTGSGQLAETSRQAGDAVVFGEHYVHDVRNTGSQTAVSVHAYSPPLSLMNYCDVEDHGLVRLAPVWTDDPETPLPNLTVASWQSPGRRWARCSPLRAASSSGCTPTRPSCAWLAAR